MTGTDALSLDTLFFGSWCSERSELSEPSEPSECIGEDRKVSDVMANSYFEVLGEKPPTKKLTEVN